MIYLITGGSGSGKSAYAEALMEAIATENKVYLATMQVRDEESCKKVRRHQQLRENKGFETIEVPLGIQNIKTKKEDSILLECLSNLVANEMFENSGAKKDTYNALKKGLIHLKEHSRNLVIVGNEIFGEIPYEDEGTCEYVKTLANITTFATEISDVVIEVVYGIPIFRKGENLCKN